MRPSTWTATSIATATFQHCRVVYSGGEPYTLATCVIAHNRIEFDGAALRTVRTLVEWYREPGLRPIAEGIVRGIQGG